MKVLITGAHGYLGLALCHWLAKDGHEVCPSGRPPRQSARSGVCGGRREVYMRAVREITERGASGFEAIVHLAGGGAPGGQSSDAAAALRDNVESAAHIASIAPPGCRLILASTIYTYGTGPRPFVEGDTLRPDTLYGQLKAVAEAVWRQRGGTALRFAHIYGIGSGVDFGRDGVTERLARAAVGGAPFEMHGDGSQRIDLVHIDDACAAVEAALVAPELPPAVNIGGGAAVTVAELMRAFGAAPATVYADCVQSLATRAPGAYGELRAMDISLAKQALGWTPKVALADGAKGLIEMMRGAK